MAIIGEMRNLTIGGKTYTIPGYTLPIASASTLGGVRIGSGLAIESGTGILSVTNATVTETDPVFSASAAAGITSTDISNWNGKTNTNISYDSSSRTLKKTVNGTTSDVVDFGTAAFKLYTTTVTSNGTGLPTSAAVASFVEGKGYITGYTETDPVFLASAAAGITATDISNWNAKVSDDKTWNGVTLEKNTTYGSNFYVPNFSSTSASSARLTYVTTTPSAGRIPRYDSNDCLISTTPSANDNSTKVATTAYVDAAIPDTSGFVSKSGDTMSGQLVLNYNNINNNNGLVIASSTNNKAWLHYSGVISSGSTATMVLKLETMSTTNGVILDGIETFSGSSYDNTAASKKYVDDSIPQVYSSTNTGGYLTMATLPIYNGTVV